MLKKSNPQTQACSMQTPSANLLSCTASASVTHAQNLQPLFWLYTDFLISSCSQKEACYIFVCSCCPRYKCSQNTKINKPAQLIIRVLGVLFLIVNIREYYSLNRGTAMLSTRRLTFIKIFNFNSVKHKLKLQPLHPLPKTTEHVIAYDINSVIFSS